MAPQVDTGHHYTNPCWVCHLISHTWNFHLVQAVIGIFVWQNMCLCILLGSFLWSQNPPSRPPLKLVAPNSQSWMPVLFLLLPLYINFSFIRSNGPVIPRTVGFWLKAKQKTACFSYIRWYGKSLLLKNQDLFIVRRCERTGTRAPPAGLTEKYIVENSLTLLYRKGRKSIRKDKEGKESRELRRIPCR